MDPRTPPAPEFAAWPPIGWGYTMPWKERLAEWQKRSRKERINYPGDRLRRDARPVPIGGDLVWSPGGCATREMERRAALGRRPGKLLARGFWLVDGSSIRRIKNIDFWFDQHEAKIRAVRDAELTNLAKLRAKALEVCGAIDRLALLADES